MTINRKEFFKKACLAGTCFCGFLSFAAEEPDIPGMRYQEEPEDKNRSFIQDWISGLLRNIDENMNEDECRKIMKPCALAHYNFLGMDDMLNPFLGNVDEFVQFIGNEWGWIIEWDQKSGVIIADENKKHCVCPLVNQEKGVKSAILCHCSEGFAELMFSKVIGKPTEARIISSIHRGNEGCKYEIKIT